MSSVLRRAISAAFLLASIPLTSAHANKRAGAFYELPGQGCVLVKKITGDRFDWVRPYGRVRSSAQGTALSKLGAACAGPATRRAKVGEHWKLPHAGCVKIVRIDEYIMAWTKSNGGRGTADRYSDGSKCTPAGATGSTAPRPSGGAVPVVPRPKPTLGGGTRPATITRPPAGGTTGTDKEKKRFKVGDKVQVMLDGCFVDAVYARYLDFSNMRATPHSAKFDFKYGGARRSGASRSAPNQIRKPKRDAKLCPTVTDNPKPTARLAKKMTRGIANVINAVRKNPKAWADRHLVPLKGKYKKVFDDWFLDLGRGHGSIFLGSKAKRDDHERWLDETIAALKGTGDVKGPKGGGRIKPMKKLIWNNKLAKSAGFFTNDSGRVNGPAHTDSQGRSPAQRARAAGYTGGVAESISGDPRSARRAVIQLLIDWTIPSRGHRAMVINPGCKQIGVSVKAWPKTGNTSAYIRATTQCGFGE